MLDLLNRCSFLIAVVAITITCLLNAQAFADEQKCDKVTFAAVVEYGQDIDFQICDVLHSYPVALLENPTFSLVGSGKHARYLYLKSNGEAAKDVTRDIQSFLNAGYDVRADVWFFLPYQDAGTNVASGINITITTTFPNGEIWERQLLFGLGPTDFNAAVEKST